MKTKIIILISGIFLLGFATISCNEQSKKNQNITVTKTINIQKEKVATTKKPGKLKSSEVCYVNNAFMRAEQIPVIVEGKIYYGCCEGCVDKLKNNLDGVRYSTDPLTGEKVDKATAYIVLKPNSTNEVLYFSSEKNYTEFVKL